MQRGVAKAHSAERRSDMDSRAGAAARFDMDPAWSETGDRYLLKLFRDYVFHQVDDNNEPVVNLAHVVSCLNKVRAAARCGRTHTVRRSAHPMTVCEPVRASRRAGLAQLDAGHPEKIVLTSRDGQSCLIVSYRDLKQCIDTVFKELQARKGT